MPPLSDVTVLDVTQMVAGPFASMQLADLGADVYKVERPDGGELGRSNPPFVDGQSAYFAAVNRNKGSVALDLQSDRGREAFLSLAEKADVVVENHPPGRLERFGVGYDAVSERNPGIVYCSITGFGQTGPYRELPALDIVAQAMSGVMSMTGPADGKPHRAGVPIGDIAASMYAVQSIVLALYESERTGEGDYLDVSMLDCLIQWLTVRAGYSWGTGEPYPRMGNSLEEFVPYGIYETADGYLAVVVVADHHWEKLCTAIDREDLADDERFATAPARIENREAVDDLLESALARAPADKWFDRFREHRVPAAPVLDTQEVWRDEHVRARDLRTSVEADGTELPAIRYPVSVGDADGEITGGVPDLGEQTREALRAAGVDEERIEAVVAAIEPPSAE
ncbi:CaiB/BaiF CoA transferase family protein [Haloplanus sp. GCM10025708]|uniref:CaiB/BaiF CoA transferase family protein n=1 Tax=Haloferacaceae TaxID=1644056 RepID=UPI00360DF025